MKINLGSNDIRILGFINIDHRKAENVDVVDDVFNIKFIENNTVDEIIAAHIIEHASFGRTVDILKKWKDLLKKTGKLWISVPNFELVYTEHLNNYLNKKISWEYFNSRIFGNELVAKKMYGEEEVLYPGVLSYELAYHKSVFTSDMLHDCLVRAGFSNISKIKCIPGKKEHNHEIAMVATNE